MRPKILEIEGLQSFTEAQIIDFDTLAESGLFGIFGPTGSGKSTILDAITFALYGRVKRAEGGTQGIINSRCRTARVAYTFELNRNGVRTTYRMERTYQRKKNSLNACEPKVVRLIQITESEEIPLCDKAMEASAKIRELLGLNNDDFTRAVVIPQNSFQDFLMLNNSERRGMLERVFYLEEYGRQLNDKISRKIAILKSRIDVLTGELSGYTDASEDALKKAKREMEEASKLKDDVERELKGQEVLYNQAKEIWSLVRDMEDTVRKEREHKILEPEIVSKRQKLDKAVKADGLAAMINKSRELQLQLNETNTQLQKVMAELPGETNKLTETRTQYEGIRRESAIHQPRLVEQRTRLLDAFTVRQEIASLSARSHELTGLESKSKKAIDAIIEDIKGAEEEYDQLKKRLGDITKETEALKTKPEYRSEIQAGAVIEGEIERLDKSQNQQLTRKATIEKATQDIEKKLSDVQKEIEDSLKTQEELSSGYQALTKAKPGDRASVLGKMEYVRTAQGTYQMMVHKKKEIDQLIVKNEAQKSALKDLEHLCKEFEDTRLAVAATCEERHRELDQCIKELDTHTAYTLSTKLKEGEPCPVCGSSSHPMPATYGSSEEFGVLEKKAEAVGAMLTKAENELKEREKDALISVESLKAKREQLELSIRELENKEREFEAEGQKLPQRLKGLELEIICQEIDRADASIKEKLQAIDVWEKEHTALKEQLDKHNNVIGALLISENGIKSELRVNHDNEKQLKDELKEMSEKLDTMRLRHSEFLVRHSIISAVAELKKLSENDRSLSRMEDELERTRKMADEARKRIEQSNVELTKLNAEHIKLESDLKGMTDQISDKERRINELTGGTDIEEGLRSIDERLKGFEADEEKYSQRLEKFEKHCNELNTKKSLLDNQLNIYKESLQNETVKLTTSLTDNGFSGIEEAEASIIKPEIQKALKAEIEQYEQVLVNLVAQKQLLEKKLEARTITQEEWEQMEKLYMELVEQSKSAASASEVAKSSFSNIKAKHKRWVEIKKVYNEVNHKYGLFDQIQKLLKARHRKDNSFIDYIAEERLRYVAAKASQTLDDITRHKYALELDTESGFIIRDNANGGIHRMVSSLSGGETFLVSLSLALALSEQIQLKGQSPLEFFFLDEGFGTLDQGLLDTVLDSLERLSSNQRVIGVISHVPELKARMSYRLAVTPPTIDGEGSTVTIERA